MLVCDRCKQPTDTLFGLRSFVRHGDPKVNPDKAFQVDAEPKRGLELCAPCMKDVEEFAQSEP